ncbi:hypothetical protein HDU86_001946 [Geranomyces michiganensis]|nr:hypothetical protein HDU86_001946 [Geranomyces michiganensis]
MKKNSTERLSGQNKRAGAPAEVLPAKRRLLADGVHKKCNGTGTNISMLGGVLRIEDCAKALTPTINVDENSSIASASVQPNSIGDNVVHLEDHEKFRDENGKIVEILTRGKRSRHEIYYRARDISVLIADNFEAEDGSSSSKPRVGSKTEDYVAFRRSEIDGTKDLYLTLLRRGTSICKLAQAVRSPSVFDWAVEVAQACHVGSQDQKIQVIAGAARTDLKTAALVFKTFTPPPCGVYLVSIGTLGDLRPSMGIKNKGAPGDLVVKFGITARAGDPNSDRLTEHMADFGAISPWLYDEGIWRRGVEECTDSKIASKAQ